MSLAEGKVVLALEGGYDKQSLYKPSLCMQPLLTNFFFFY